MISNKEQECGSLKQRQLNDTQASQTLNIKKGLL